MRDGMRHGALGALALAALLGAGCTGGDPGEARAGTPGTASAGADLRGVALPTPQLRPDFTLTDTEGRPYDFRARTQGRLTLLFFGYTHCPDVCPVHLANIAAVLPRVDADVTVVFVTTDPERDTPTRIREWLDNFDTRFVGLRGDTAAVNAVQRGLGIAPAVQTPDPSGEGYAVSHAGQVIAFTADDSAHVAYPFGTRQSDWAWDLPRLARAWPAARPAVGARTYGAGALTVHGVVAPAPVGDAPGAAYFTVVNADHAPDTLVAVTSPDAGDVSVHAQRSAGGATRMELRDAVPVPARGRVRFAPGGLHVMLDDWRRRPAAGDTLPLVLEFRRAGRLPVAADVVRYEDMDALFPPAPAGAGAGAHESH